MHTCIRISDTDSDVRTVDVEFGEWKVRVIPWVNYTGHGEGWISLNVRRTKGSGKCSFWLTHNGTRFARSKDLQAAPDLGLPIDDLARYMRQVWGR